MAPKPVVPRARAVQDLQDAVAFYGAEGGARIALAFIDTLERAFNHLGRRPSTGSFRYAQELDLPGLRSWPLPRFPYLIFYVDNPDQVDVWRVLHGHRDLPAWLARDPA